MKRQRELAFAEMMNQKGIKGALFRLMKIDKKGETQAQKFIKKLIDSEKDVVKYNFMPLNAKWHREHFKYNVLEDLKKVTCPVLAVTGSKDFQANPERLKDVPGLVKGKAECKVIENMDHSLKKFTGTISAVNFKSQYKESANKPIHNDLKKVLTDWLAKTYLNSEE